MKSDKILGVITGFLLLSGILTITWTVYATWLIKRQSFDPPNLKCIYTTKNDTMGTSELGHILTKGQTYKVLMGYYRCNEVSRGDLVLYQFSDEILPVIRIVRGIPNDQIETREVSNHLVNQGQINGWSLNLLQDFLRTFIDKKGQKLTINLRGSIEITFAQSAKFLLIQAQLYFLANKPKHGWIYLQKLFAAVLFQKTVRPSHDLSCKLFIKDSALLALIDTPYLEVRMQEYFAQHNQIKLLNPCLTSLIIRHRLE